MSNIHTHHGYHPLFRKQTPFWWEAPSGRKLLVWNGEHYNLGNELGIAQTSWFEYTVHDGISNANLSEYEKACMRIEAYVRSVQEQEYPYDFIPVGVSSGMTDNAPPSLAIPEFIRKFLRPGSRDGGTAHDSTRDRRPGFFDALRNFYGAHFFLSYNGHMQKDCPLRQERREEMR